MQLPLGFKFGGLACGIKPSGKKDLAIISTDEPAVAAGVYTQNVVCAASIDWNRSITPSDQFRGLVVNSGNANACTGKQGVANNLAMAKAVADSLGGKTESVAVLSTGVIGHQLPLDQVRLGIEKLMAQTDATEAGFEDAADAITTTDKSRKTASRQIKIDGETISVAAMAKGAGMIGPKMATMLAVVCTDANVSVEQAAAMVKQAADRSFNQISVEGHTSTNDALLLVCSGRVGKVFSSDGVAMLQSAIDEVCIETAKMIPADGEGASHLIEIEVKGAACNADAETVARTIASSNLVKTAIAGADPNWGRIVSAAGYADVPMAAEAYRLELNGFLIFADGEPVDFDAKAVSDAIAESFDTKVSLRVGNGPGTAKHWTSDLTVDYVRFNSEYTT
jgi:glutamate N-acetyltransferase/amino-acid N-acetyltransferase